MVNTAPPGGYTYGPVYRLRLPLVLRGWAAILRGRPRSLARDGLTVLANMPVPPLVRGADHIPEDGNCIVVANHYERSRLWMAWPAILISHAVQERTGKETHWIAIEEWDSFSVVGLNVPRRLIRAVFERAFAVYGIIAMPPLAAPAAARAGAMRRAAKQARSGNILGIMPEGTVGPTPELLPTPEGVGQFLLLLAAGGAKILPVGLYEESDRLVAQFGQTFLLHTPDEVPKAARDEWARTEVMEAIKLQIPPELWGWYARPAERDRAATQP